MHRWKSLANTQFIGPRRIRKVEVYIGSVLWELTCVSTDLVENENSFFKCWIRIVNSSIYLKVTLFRRLLYQKQILKTQPEVARKI